MPACPSCQAEIDLDADLCLSCGEPLGDSPAARMARAEAAAPRPAAPLAPPPLAGRPTADPAPVAPTTAPVRSSGGAPPARATLVEAPAARRRRVEEPEKVRCPGCGVPSTAARCPGCGGVLRRDD